MILLEVVDESLLLSPFRTILTLSTLVWFGHELFDTDDRNRLKRRDDVLGDMSSVSS